MQLRTMESETFDSLVTDPPAGIGFMGKEWDHHKGGRDQWVSWMAEVMRECHRVLKPGAHGLVWALPRTSHWTATALEDAGFEVRDVVTHLFGSGFPKSLDVSKAIDKAAGAEREVVGIYRSPENTSGRSDGSGSGFGIGGLNAVTSPTTDAAKHWQGWGTALKPASEHWILVRKPCSEKTVAANVLKWGTGALNIDASRIGISPADPNHRPGANEQIEGGNKNSIFGVGNQRRGSLGTGRFPANLVLSHTPYCTDDICDLECAIKMLDEQSGTLKSGAFPQRRAGIGYTQGAKGNTGTAGARRQMNEGGASRFFYVAKISKSERNAGLEGMPERMASVGNLDAAGRDPLNPANYTGGSRKRVEAGLPATEPRANHHPTVKPKRLMTYLIRMVTPPGGVVLDPFMGSGSTGVAAVESGFDFLGIEREPDYFEIAEKRVPQ